MPERIPADLRVVMLENGRRSAAGVDHDPHPVVKLFTPRRQRGLAAERA